MATIKKACKGAIYPKSSSVSKRLGSPSKAKKGGSFPDLNKDGKITKADILKGRGVIAKKRMKVRKAQTGTEESSKTLPGVTVTSEAEPKKNLIDKIFGTKEERANRKINRENNRESRQAYRSEKREERRERRSCRGGRCGGRAKGFSGYDKNGGTTTKKAKTGTSVKKSSGKTKKCAYGCK